MDDVFDAFSMLSQSNLVSLMHVGEGFTRFYIDLKGVDTGEIYDIVKTFPITTVQGKLFYEPLNFDDMEKIIIKLKKTAV